MPKVERRHVPAAVIEHLVRRIRERQVSVDALQALAIWLDRNPTVPAGAWFKRFPDIVVCGEGALVKTILEQRHTAIGEEVE